MNEINNNINNIFFRYAPDAYYIMDLKGVLLDGNPASEKITGYKREELMGKGLFGSGILKKSGIPMALKLLAKNALGMSTGPDEIEIIKKDGRSCMLEISTHPVFLEGKRVVLGIARDITSRKADVEKIRQGRKKSEDLADFLSILMDTIPNPVFYKDPEGIYRGCNKAFADLILGMPEDRIVGNSVLDIHGAIPEDLAKVYHEKDMELIKKGGTQTYEASVKCADGKMRDFRFYKAVYIMEGRKAGLIGIMLDITESKKLERELFQSEEKCRTIFDSARDVIIMHDLDGNIMNANKSAESLYGYPKDVLIGMNIRDIAHSMGKLEQKKIEERLKDIRDKGSLVFETVLLDSDSREIAVEINARVIEFAGKKAIVSISRDITRRKQTEELVKNMAYKDSLTGLPNRRLFDDRFQIACSGADRNNSRLAILVMDLDGFKDINDSYGHQVGDQVLIEVGRRLRQSIRRSDTVARLGGDEFIILLSDIKTEEDADKITRKIQRFFRDYFLIEGHKIKISLSIGTSIYPDDGRELEELIKKSDKAMYWVKNHGRDGYRLYKEAGKVQS
jgi:diguanylate cyclase (GGDEF)-like protein/PAS domain S-box-containing protein